MPGVACRFCRRALLLPDPCPAERFTYLVGIIPLVQERLRTLAEAPELLDYFLCQEIDPPAQDLLVGRKQTVEQVLTILGRSKEILSALPDFDETSLEQALRGLAAELGIRDGEVMMPIRAAISGRSATPGLFDTLSAIGRERSLERIGKAMDVLARG